MPKFDGTGPMGQGAGTGRGMGPCGLGARRGWGYCRGCCFGRRFGFRRFFSVKNKLTDLEEQEKILEEELENVRQEKSALENSDI